MVHVEVEVEIDGHRRHLETSHRRENHYLPIRRRSSLPCENLFAQVTSGCMDAPFPWRATTFKRNEEKELAPPLCTSARRVRFLSRAFGVKLTNTL